MKRASFIAAQFALGGIAYCGIEVIYRGYTHRSMLAAGGLCFVLLCLLARSQVGLFTGAVIGGLAITAVELVVGAIVNLWLGLGVWDYSRLPFNLWGQVSLQFTLAWFLLSGLVILLARIIRGAALLYWERMAKRAISAEKAAIAARTEQNRIG
ncbi:MAG: putative ABC transporter permease [Oscillospiraceae bacterium]|nr:putative ABC transporter permease [Oscillospiraceae bacterium]